MKRLDLSRYAISLCAAVMFLAGCGQFFNTSGAATGAVPGAVHIVPAKGGEFSASYSGKYESVKSRGFGHYTIVIDGSGTASFLGPSRESGKLDEHCSMGCFANGTLTLRSSRHTNSAIFMFVAFNGGWCTGPQNTGTYFVKRGKSRFRGATGNGTVAVTCPGSTYSDQWSGTLNFNQPHQRRRQSR